jgi:hypothetical protein
MWDLRLLPGTWRLERSLLGRLVRPPGRLKIGQKWQRKEE